MLSILRPILPTRAGTAGLPQERPRHPLEGRGKPADISAEKTRRTQTRYFMSHEIDRIAETSQEDPNRQFFSIAHLITPEALEAAFRSLRRRHAGVDGLPTKSMRRTLENIRQLHQRLTDERSGSATTQDHIRKRTEAEAISIPPGRQIVRSGSRILRHL